MSKERKGMYYPPQNNPHHGNSHQAPSSVPPTGQYPPLYQPMYPPNPPTPGQFYSSPPQPPNNSSTPYSRTILFILICAYVAFWLFVFVAGAYSPNGFAVFLGNVGISLLWGTLVSVLIMDWRGFFTINGWIRWRQIKGAKRILLGLLFLCTFPLLMGVYLVRALLMYRRSSQQIAPGSVPIPSPSRRPRLGILVGVVVTLCALFMYSVGNASSTGLGNTDTMSSSVSPTATRFVAVPPTPEATQTVTQPTVVPTKAPSPTSTMRPTPIPTQPPAPTPTPAPQPTQAQTTGVNGNPWGYNFQVGNLIYNPPSNFCAYFNCIKSFWESTNGYVDECNDGMYSHSGGVSGACSRHGGEMRP